MSYDSWRDLPSVVDGVSCDKKTDLSLLLSRLELLDEPEGALMRMFWEQNFSPEQMARMEGGSSSAIRRRIGRLTRRILDGRYVCFYRQQNRFGSEQMAMVYDIYILGMGYRRIARKYGLELWLARKILRGFNRWLDEQNNND